MPSEITTMLDDFHAVLGNERGRGNAGFRWRLHEEEHEKLLDELTDKRLGIDVREPKADEDVDRAKLARELADVVYVAFGTAHAFNIDLDAALAEIHRAAMSKLDPVCPHCGAPVDAIVREDGKVMKPEGFVPPDMSKAVR